MTRPRVEYNPGDLVYINLPGEAGLFPATVVFSFTSDYDAGVYYVLRPANTVPWETHEVRSRWQIVDDPRGPLPYTDKLRERIAQSKPTHRKYEGPYVNYTSLDPAHDAALALDEEDGDDYGEYFDDEDDDEPFSGGDAH